MRQFLLVLLLPLFLLSVTCDRARPERATEPKPAAPPANAVGTNPAPEPLDGWIRPAKDYASTRFSELDQITPDSVKQLGPKLTFSTGVVRGHEAAPLVVNGLMYIVTPYPNYLYALDLAQPGGPVKWKYEPKPLSMAQGVAC